MLSNVSAIGISKVQPIRKRRERLKPRGIPLMMNIVSTHRRLVNDVASQREQLATSATTAKTNVAARNI
jgi:hypothetical protein